MSSFQSMTGSPSRIKNFIREKISPRATNLYAQLGFANRRELTSQLKQFRIENYDKVLDLLLSRGILKSRFYKDIFSLDQLEEYMLAGSITPQQIKAIEEDIRCLATIEKIGRIGESLEAAAAVEASAEATTQFCQGQVFNTDTIFTKASWNLAASLDRIFPEANGIHSKFLQAISPFSIFNFSSLETKNGPYRIGFGLALTLGSMAIIASPFLFPTLGSAICGLGLKTSLALKIIGGTMLVLGSAARIAKHYTYMEGDEWYKKAFAYLGRSKTLDRFFFPLGLSLLYLSFTFGTAVSNTFVLGEYLLNHGDLLAALTIGIPSAAILGSAAYSLIGIPRAIRANSAHPAPYGNEEIRRQDIIKTHLYSGTAVSFSLAYFLYRFAATSLFVSAAFFPISLTSFLLTMGAAAGGYLAGHLLPLTHKKFRSPWFSFISGTLGTVAAPMILGACIGDYGSVTNTASAIISLAVLAQDIHGTSHGTTYHLGQIASLYPDRLVPQVNLREKRALAGFYGRKGKPKTSFWEKAHVNPPDIVFSALTSALFEPNAYLKQCLLQCDAPNRGTGAKAKDVRNIVKITEKSQAVLNEVYSMCRQSLEAFRRIENRGLPDEEKVKEGYRILIKLLREDLSKYFCFTLENKIKEMCDEFNQEWKGIYDVTIDIAFKKGMEFDLWARELEERLKNNDQLTREEVLNTLLYLCDRFDKEFILGIRKDSNQYVMRIQKNENQSGLREFVGNTAYEIMRFNAKTGLASIDRILATHIRRQNMEWEHKYDENGNPSGKYTWEHRTELDQKDSKVIREYRARVESHSEDLAFVINDNEGKPLALQTKDGQILLIEDNLSTPVTLKVASGEEVTINPNLSCNHNNYQVTTIKKYNQTHDNKIYFIANPANPKKPIKIEDPPEGVNDYYTKHDLRPLYVYAIDPHDYEFNLDSEFVNGRIAFEYIPIFEADRRNKYAAITYRMRREVMLDMEPSGIPRERNNEPLMPSRVVLNWAPMYLRVKTVSGQEYIVPFLEEKNGQVEPKITVEKPPMDWSTFRRKWAQYFTKGEFNNKNGKFEVILKNEYWNQAGISEVKVVLPKDPFVINGIEVTPSSAEEFISLLEDFERRSTPEALQNIQIKHYRTYNWRRIKEVKVNQAEGKIYFIYDTENGTEKEDEMPYHQSNTPKDKNHQPAFPNYSLHLPPIADIKGIEIEVFRKSVGTLPYASYTYRFTTLEEAEQYGYAQVERDKEGNPIVEPNDPTRMRMKKGCPIWRVLDEKGNVVGYEFVRFGRPESIFELGALDPSSIDPHTIKIVRHRDTWKLSFEAAEFSTKLFPIESGLADELGIEENPRAEIKEVITDPKELEKHFGSGSILWTPKGIIKLNQVIKNPESVLEVQLKEVNQNKATIKIIRKEKYGEHTFTNESFREMWYSAEWVEKVEFGEWTEEKGREIKIFYRNPHTGLPLEGERRCQTLYCKDERLRDVSRYYGARMELREIYDKAGNCHLDNYLTFTRTQETTLTAGVTEEEKEYLQGGKLLILTPRSALRVKINGSEEKILPLNDKVDGEDYIFDEKRTTPQEIELFSHHLPHFEDGKVGLIIGPQLSISGRNWFGYTLSGVPYCAFDQSIFMAYDLSSGYNYGRETYADGIGGGNIQPHKSRAGDGRIREGATVQNGTPVGRPIRKTLASSNPWYETELRAPFISWAPMPATITEDYREGKGIYKKHGHAAVFCNKVVAVGAGVEHLQQILTQRRRWPTSVPIGQYWFFRDLWDELIQAKILKRYPSFYTWDQLLHEWNGVTWYYCGMAEYLRSFAPLAYFAGLTAYPVDSIAFPSVWLGYFVSSMASHVYSMKKVGNHPLESIYWGQAAYKALVPNYFEMLLPQPDFKAKTQGRRFLEELVTCRLAKECLGQFGVTALTGGSKLDERYLRQITDDIWLKATTYARGLLEMQNITEAFKYQGVFGSDLFSQATAYFAIVMNTIWPYYDLLLNRGALQLANDDHDKDSNLANKTRSYLMAQALQGKISKNRLQYYLGIPNMPPEPARFLQEITAAEIREVFSYMPQKAASMLEEMLNQGKLSSAKVATILEAMLHTQEERIQRIQGLFWSKHKKYKNRPLDETLMEAQDEADRDILFSTGLAVYLFKHLSPKNQERIKESMKKEKQNLLVKIS